MAMRPTITTPGNANTDAVGTGNNNAMDRRQEIVETGEAILGQMMEAYGRMKDLADGDAVEDEAETAFQAAAAERQEREELGLVEEGEDTVRSIYAGPVTSEMPPRRAIGRDGARQDVEARTAPPVGMPDFKPLLRAPGYSASGPQGEVIRSLGRTIFRSVASFRILEERSREAGVDPLGQLRLCAAQGTVIPPAMQNFLDWLQENASPMHVGRVNFGALAPNYNPQIVGAMTDHDTYLIVRETSPGPATYIYAMPGGRLDMRNNLATAPDRREAVAHQRRPHTGQTRAQPREAASVPPAEPRPPGSPAVAMTQGKQGGGETSPLGLAAMKAMGFALRGTAAGPRMVLGRDGVVFEAASTTGPLSLAKEFTVSTIRNGERNVLGHFDTSEGLEKAMSDYRPEARQEAPNFRP